MLVQTASESVTWQRAGAILLCMTRRGLGDILSIKEARWSHWHTSLHLLGLNCYPRLVGQRELVDANSEFSAKTKNANHKTKWRV
jgi:hypothetical protein